MPPKRKRAAKPKNKLSKNGGSSATVKDTSDRVLRKDPKKKVFVDESEDTTNPKRSAKTQDRALKSAKTKGSRKKNQNVDNHVQLTLRESEDDFSEKDGDNLSQDNHSSNAVTMSDSESKGESSSETEVKGQTEQITTDMAGEINKHVDAALSKYFRKKRTKRNKKKRKRRETASSSSEGTSGSSSDSDVTSYEDDSSSDSSEDRRKARKRKRKERKRKSRKDRRNKRGKSMRNDCAMNVSSESTIYTRGCKSPQNAIIEASSDGSLDGGNIPSDAGTEEFMDSMNSSRDHANSTPFTGDQAPRSKRSKEGERVERSDREEMYRERADSVIRDLHMNKADLAKPSGECSEFMLASLIRDFKHFHLTSHVDKKIKERVKEQDFTIDFRRLLPRSRSKIRYDERMQVVHDEGNTYFVPAGERDLKEILGYKTWETAFKVFMGLFNQHWPERMQELLQYSYVIQTASNNHPWESVYNYDIAFREIMTEQPNTHWGVISQQTWTLEFGENSVRHGVPQAAATQPQQGKGKKVGSNPCWRFNKGKCTFGENCEYDHRCSHCGKRGHGRHECFKRLKNEKGREFKRERSTKN